MTLTTRDATVADYPLFARLFPELAVPDPLPTKEAFATNMLPHVLVGLEDAEDAGYSYFLFYGKTAHVGHVVVDPQRRGRRVGEAMLTGVKSRARAAGCTRAYLNVKRENASAIRLYERAGFHEEGCAWVLRVPWSVADALGRDTRAKPFMPTDDGDTAIAAHFGVPRERLALLRGRPHTTFVALERDGDTVGFAAFNAAYPGTYPFCAKGGELAGSLLAALRPFADHARFDYLHVTIEDDGDVARALEAGGAQMMFEIARMAATL